jgi:CheY-like chemotaxis protein
VPLGNDASCLCPLSLCECLPRSRLHTSQIRITGCFEARQRLVQVSATTIFATYGEYVETQSKRILVVDDFAPWRGFLKTLLVVTPEWQIGGEAINGADALKKAQELQPDLVLLDIDLPDVSGIDLARQLQIVAPNTKIVFLTAQSSCDIANVALSTGALGYLLKSQVISELLPALKSVFSNNRFVSQGIEL